MLTYIEADLTHCQNKKPMAIIKNMPGEGVHMRPTEMRAFAIALLSLADQCERRVYDPHQLRVKRITVPL